MNLNYLHLVRIILNNDGRENGIRFAMLSGGGALQERKRVYMERDCYGLNGGRREKHENSTITYNFWYRFETGSINPYKRGRKKNIIVQNRNAIAAAVAVLSFVACAQHN